MERKLTDDRTARLLGMLWSRQSKLRMEIPLSALFLNGSVHSVLFTAKSQNGEIRRKAQNPTVDDIEQLWAK